MKSAGSFKEALADNQQRIRELKPCKLKELNSATNLNEPGHEPSPGASR